MVAHSAGCEQQALSMRLWQHHLIVTRTMCDLSLMMLPILQAKFAYTLNCNEQPLMASEERTRDVSILQGAARVKNYPHQRSPEVRIKAFRKTSVKVFGEKRGPSEVCRYIFYKAQYRALPEPQKLQLCFSLKKRLMRRALCSFLSAQKGD